jgi:site-specific DNA-methyltransferase (adenine-specific)
VLVVKHLVDSYRDHDGGHAPSVSGRRNGVILVGDCVELMRELEPASVDAIVTDPPYGLEFMGKEWDRLSGAVIQDPATERGGFQDGNGGNPYSRSRIEYGRSDTRAMQDWHHAWATEALRVLKPGGHLLAFGGTRTYHRLACAIEDAGFEIRDCLAWMFGSGFPKSHNIPDFCHVADRAHFIGWGTALKPAHEPIVVARKPLAGTVAANVLAFGTGALNIDASRISSGQRPTMEVWENDENLCASCAVDAGGTLRPPTLATEASTAQSNAAPMQNGKVERHPGDTSKTATGSSSGLSPVAPSADPSDGISSSTAGSGSNPTGLSPTATSSTTSTETGRTIGSRTCNSCGGPITPHTITEAYQNVDRWPSNVLLDDEAALMLGEVARFFYCAKSSRAERNAGLEGFEERDDKVTESAHSTVCAKCGRQRVNVQGACKCVEPEWIRVQQRPLRNHHPTVKPVALMRWLVRLVTPPGGTVLDPFAGSGTTGIAAALEGFQFLGMEQDAEYARIAEARIAFWTEHGEEGLRIVAEREKADAEREAMAALGQIGLFEMPAELRSGNGREGEASADRRYTDRGSTNFAPKPGRRRP